MQVVAREATEVDIPVLAELYEKFRHEIATERGGIAYLSQKAVSRPVDGHFAGVLGDSAYLVVLGLLDQVPVGLAVARLYELADSTRSTTAEVIYVDPAAREVGVGESLLDAIVGWAELRGAGGLDIPVLPGMRASKNFLEGAGFVARLLVMHRRLG